MTTTTGPKISSWAMRMSLRAIENGRFDIESAGLGEHPLPAMRDPRTLLDAKLDVAEHPLHMARLDERAELRAGVERMAERNLALLHRGDFLDQRLTD